MSRTSFGLRIRATLENPRAGAVSGISTASMDVGTTFAFGAALVGLAGALLVPVFSLFADLAIASLSRVLLQSWSAGSGPLSGPWRRAALIRALSAALPWVMAPCAVDILVFALAIVFI